jgi:hypothetical protein
MKSIILAATLAVLIYVSLWAQPACVWSDFISKDTIGYDSAEQMIIDSHGNIYIAGYSDATPNGRYDAASAKIDSAGSIIWKNFYDNQGNYDVAHGITFDNNGNTYVAGVSGISTGEAVFIVKYDSLGNQLWASLHTGQEGTNPLNRETAITCDSLGNSYICFGGWRREIGFPEYMTVAKYGPDGGLLHEMTLDMASSAYSNRILLNGNDLYAVGNIENPNNSDNINILLVKLNTDCDTIWTRQFGIPDSQLNEASVLVADNDGNLIIGGTALAIEGGWRPLIAKFDPDGNLLWYDILYSEAFSGTSSIKVDITGNIYCQGTYNNIPYPYWRGTNFFTAKYSPVGEQLWFNGFSDGRTAYDYHSDMSIDVFGNAYAACTSRSGDNNSATMIKYNAAGGLEWVTGYEAPGDADGGCGEIEIDDAGNLYITGVVDTDPSPSDSLRPGVNFDILVAKFDNEHTSIWSGNGNIPEQISLFHNYPNPFNAQTTISYSLSESGPATLTIYNLLGQKVAVLFDGVQTAGEHKTVWDAGNQTSGIYFYRISAGRFIKSEKMLLLK